MAFFFCVACSSIHTHAQSTSTRPSSGPSLHTQSQASSRPTRPTTQAHPAKAQNYTSFVPLCQTRCIARCQRRYQRRHLRCLQFQKLQKLQKIQKAQKESILLCPLFDWKQNCTQRCARLCKRRAHRRCRICSAQYLRRLRQCQELSPAQQKTCFSRAMQRKELCLKWCPRIFSGTTPQCLQRCTEHWKLRHHRCQRYAKKDPKRSHCEAHCHERTKHCIQWCNSLLFEVQP